MSTPTWWRSASPNTASRWATGSRSNAHGRAADDGHPPHRRGWPRRGGRRCPDRGGCPTVGRRPAPLGIGRRGRRGRRARRRDVPDCNRCPPGRGCARGSHPRRSSPRAVRVAWAATPSSAVRQLRRSLSTNPASVGSAVCGRNGRPSRVESRWAWTSASAGSSTPPAPSTTGSAGSASESGPIAAISPSRTIDVDLPVTPRPSEIAHTAELPQSGRTSSLARFVSVPTICAQNDRPDRGSADQVRAPPGTRR